MHVVISQDSRSIHEVLDLLPVIQCCTPSEIQQMYSRKPAQG